MKAMGRLNRGLHGYSVVVLARQEDCLDGKSLTRSLRN